MKKSRSLIYKFGIRYLIFAIIVVVIASVSTYILEMVGHGADETSYEAIKTEAIKHLFIEAGILTVTFIAGYLVILKGMKRNLLKRLERMKKAIQTFSTQGDLNVIASITADASDGDELSLLSRQLVEMLKDIGEYTRELNEATEKLREAENMEYEKKEQQIKDELTGIRNKNGYDREVKKIRKKIENGEAVFGVALVDLNDLKELNETHGTGKGDIAIKELCRLVCDVFVHSPVFRVGGDEFAVILTGEDYVSVKYLIESFNKEIKRRHEDHSIKEWDKAYAAVGYAIYDDAIDGMSFESVYKRADRAMKDRKDYMKNVL